jgi:Zn-dependent peptidase ImmA (M78 family)
MEWPEYIKMGAVNWKVEFTTLEEINKKVKGALAAISIMDGTIYICHEMSPQMIDLSLMHELVHAMDFASGYIMMDESQTMALDDVSVERRANIILDMMEQIVDYNVKLELEKHVEGDVVE